MQRIIISGKVIKIISNPWRKYFERVNLSGNVFREVKRVFLKRWIRRIMTAPFLVLMAAAVVFCYIFCGIYMEQTCAHSETLALKGISGEIFREPWNGEKDFILSARDADGQKYRILVKGEYMYSGQIGKLIKAGVCTAGELKVKTPETAGNWYEFDYCRYLRSHGIDYYTYANNGDLEVPGKVTEGFLTAEYTGADGAVRTLRRSLAYYSSRIREDISGSLDKYFSGDFSALIKAVMTGETGALDIESRSNLTSAGFSHLIAVSGAHVSFFTLPFAALLGRTTIAHDKRKLLLIIPVVFLWFAAGGSCTVTRAALMFIFGAVAEALRKPPNVKNTLGLAGLIALATNPYTVFSTGFLLSYGAVLSIAEILPALKKIKGMNNPVMSRLLPGASVNAGLLPVMMRKFGSFSPCGMLLAVPASYVACFLSIGGYLVYAADKILSWIPLNGLTRVLVSLSFGLQKAADSVSGGDSWFFRTECGAPGIVFFAVYYGLLIGAVRGRKGKAVPVLAVIVVAAALIGNGMNRVEVLFFDVGQGSAALVRTVDGVTGLVDTGTGDTDVAKLLKREGVFKLDFIVISHGHSDHYGGLANVLREFDPETVFVPDNAFDKYCNELGQCFGVETVAVNGSMSLSLGKYTLMKLSEPLEDKENLNDGSLVVSLSGKWGSIVLPGDAENGELGELLERGELGKTEVFCLAHHGSKTSGDEKFLWEISPKYVIISAGYGNSYGHPSKLVLETLEDLGIDGSAVYRTDRDGAIRVKAGIDLFGREFTVIWRKRQSLA